VSETETPVLKAPYPFPGGKSKVADLVWQRLGNVDNYVEPFMGSLATMLRRPAEHFAGGYRVETCNDLNHFIVNFWRAVKADPEAVATWADAPVLEADLHARHRWLMQSDTAAEWRERMRTDPEAHDAKIAGWWVWGACCWIGSGWCEERGMNWKQRVDLGQGAEGLGVLASPQGRPQLTDAFDIGRGVNAGGGLSQQIPDMDGGRGVLRALDNTNVIQRPNAGDGIVSSSGFVTAELAKYGTYQTRREWLIDWMQRLSDRLRLVRTCYGHWSRICDSESTMTRLGTVGAMVDPPYPLKRADNGEHSRAGGLYAGDKTQDLNALRDEVLDWCKRWGSNPEVRIALCCYEGDGYEPLSALGWEIHEWEAGGGYANQRKGKKGKADNAKRERIFFSPACLKIEHDEGLFAEIPE